MAFSKMGVGVCLFDVKVLIIGCFLLDFKMFLQKNQFCHCAKNINISKLSVVSKDSK